MASNIRERARILLNDIPEDTDITSNGTSRVSTTGETMHDMFERLSNSSHESIIERWKSPDNFTTCNGFTGYFSTRLGSPVTLGRFDLETYLPSIGKGYAWVKSTPDTRPKYGDICRYSIYHVGISLDFDGPYWKHVDSGQGGRKIGYDIIRRAKTKEPYTHTMLQGWLDLDLYFDGTPPTMNGAALKQQIKVPIWLKGWWAVTCGAEKSWYKFDGDGNVYASAVAPSDATQPPLIVTDSGRLQIDSRDKFAVDWKTTGRYERLFHQMGTLAFTGKRNNIEPIAATKMF